MRKIKVSFLLMFVVLILAACAGIEERWATLSPDEKARIVVNDLQAQLNNLFDTSKAYVQAKPQYAEKWKKEIVPAFDVANKALYSAMVLAKSGQITPDQVYAQVQPLLNSVMNLLISIGAVKPAQSAMDVVMMLALINGILNLAFGLWSSARKVYGKEAIPSWDEIIAKNKELQAKIDAEKE